MADDAMTLQKARTTGAALKSASAIAFAPGGVLSAETILVRGVDEIRCAESNEPITSGWIDVGKHLRPNRRRHRVVLFVSPTDHDGNDDSPRIALRLT